MNDRHKIDRLTLFLIPIGVAVNFVGGQIVIMLKLPMYLDAIGTIVVGALCGGIPGAIVGLVSNLLNSITDPTYLFYAILNILYGLAAGWLANRRVFLTLWKTLLSAFIFAAIGGGLGSLITWAIYGFDFGTNVNAIFAIPLHSILGIPKYFAQLIADFCMDSSDKLVTLAAVYFILKAMPVQVLAKLPLGNIYIKDEDIH